MKTEAFAKINLTLEVFGIRPDGYHALRSAVMPVSLSDTVSVSPAEGISSDSPYADDLCAKAAKLLRAFAISSGRGNPGGCSIGVVKRIPAGGGLGGGSADAAAALFLLDRMWNLDLPQGELLEIAARTGSDVPALLLSRTAGPVAMEGRGERVSPLCRAKPPVFHFVLANPGVHSSTAEVFANYKARVEEDSPILYNMRRAIESGDPDALAGALANDLESAATGLHPEIGAALDALRKEGLAGAGMTGSGATVFGIAKDAVQAEETASRLRERGFLAFGASSIVP